MKEKIILIVAIVAGCLAFFLTRRYIANELQRIYEDAEKVNILAAARDLPSGTVLKSADLGFREEFKTAVGDDVFRPEDLDMVLDKKLKFSLKRNQALNWVHVDLPERGRGGLARMVTPGMRAVSVAIGGEAGVSGLVNPNDRVDVLGTFSFPSQTVPGEMETVTLTVLQDVSVLATGQRMARDKVGAYGGRQRSGYSTVTFEVTPREAELLVFAQYTKGRLSLTLRNPDDMYFEIDLPDINFEHLQQKLPEMNLYRQRHIRGKTEKDIPALRTLRQEPPSTPQGTP